MKSDEQIFSDMYSGPGFGMVRLVTISDILSLNLGVCSYRDGYRNTFIVGLDIDFGLQSCTSFTVESSGDGFVISGSIMSKTGWDSNVGDVWQSLVVGILS